MVMVLGAVRSPPAGALGGDMGLCGERVGCQVTGSTLSGVRKPSDPLAICQEQSRGLGLGHKHCPPELRPSPFGSPPLPKMLAMLLSSSRSVMKAGTTCRCRVTAMLEDWKLLITKVMWITSLERRGHAAGLCWAPAPSQAG